MTKQDIQKLADNLAINDFVEGEKGWVAVEVYDGSSPDSEPITLDTEYIEVFEAAVDLGFIESYGSSGVDVEIQGFIKTIDTELWWDDLDYIHQLEIVEKACADYLKWALKRDWADKVPFLGIKEILDAPIIEKALMLEAVASIAAA